MERAIYNSDILFTSTSRCHIMSDPRLVDFVRSRKAQRTPGSESASGPVQREDVLTEPLPNSASPDLDHTIKARESQRDTMEDDDEDENQLAVQPPITSE